MAQRPVGGRPNVPPQSGGGMARGPAEAPQPTYGGTRQNEYFVPRDGIDREVITADICRYLGNDALVRPGVYENKDTGMMVQGYYINAYRNLTSAMIEDLKADSARWEAERRQQASSRSGALYRNSEVHTHRQNFGPSESTYGDSSGYDNAPRYPGSGAPGYSGAGNNSYPPQAGGYSGGHPGGHPGNQAGNTFPSNTFGQQPSAFGASLPGESTRYGTATGGMSQAPFGQVPQEPPYVATGASYATNPSATYAASDPFNSMAQRERVANIPVTTVSQQSRTTYATSGGPSGGYPGSSTNPSYYQQAPAASMQYAAQPMDPFYGRGAFSSAETTPSTMAQSADYTMGGTSDRPFGYGASSVNDQYEDPSALPRTTPTGTPAQQANSGAVRRDRDNRERERDRDRETDRHAAERERHRHANRR